MTVITFLSLCSFLLFLELLIASFFNGAICNPHTENSFPVLWHIKKCFQLSFFTWYFTCKKPLSSCSKLITQALRLNCHPGVSLCHCSVGSTVSQILWLFLLGFPHLFYCSISSSNFLRKNTLEVNFMILYIYGSISFPLPLDQLLLSPCLFAPLPCSCSLS